MTNSKLQTPSSNKTPTLNPQPGWAWEFAALFGICRLRVCWSVECGVWTLECGAWRSEFGVWPLHFGFWNLEFGIWTLVFVGLQLAILNRLGKLFRSFPRPLKLTNQRCDGIDAAIAVRQRLNRLEPA